MNSFEVLDSSVDQSLEKEKKKRKERRNELTKELIENREKISFPGINPKCYAEIKSFEEEFPGFVTPLDEILERMKTEGIKVAFGIDADSGNIVFLPFESDDIKYDSILPKTLEITDNMNEKVKELIMLSKI